MFIKFLLKVHHEQVIYLSLNYCHSLAVYEPLPENVPSAYIQINPTINLVIIKLDNISSIFSQNNYFHSLMIIINVTVSSI